MVETDERAPVLLYDGVCGFCDKIIRMILDHDRSGKLRFAALQSSFAKAIIERHPELRGIDSVVFLDRATVDGRERVYVRSAAALRVASYLGGFWRLFLATHILPSGLRDHLYDLFARNRYRLFGKYDTCRLPPPEARARFLDV